MNSPSVATGQGEPYILLVDDNRNGLIARRAVLEEVGYRVQTAATGEEALEIFSANRFDLVVTDYKMPRMNGAELIEKLRSSRPDVPVILISGFVEPLGLSEDTTGADVVLAKSSHEVQHLMRSVARLLNRARNARGIPRKPPRSQGGARTRKAGTR